MHDTDSSPQSKLNLVFAFQQELCKHLQLAVPFTNDPSGVFDVEGWLAAVDSRCEVHQLRHYLLTHAVAAETLAVLVDRLIALPELSDTDRSKIDLLLVHYLAQKAEQANLPLGEAAKLLEPVLGVTTPAPIASVITLITELDTATSVRDLLSRKVLERMQKVRVQQHDYTPVSMVIFAWLGLHARRTCVRLVFADIDRTEHNLVRFTQLGLTRLPKQEGNAEDGVSISELLNKCRLWKRPFASNYRDESWLTQIADLRAITDSAVQIGDQAILTPRSAQTLVEKATRSGPDEPSQAVKKLSPLEVLIKEILCALEGVRSKDFARVQVGQVGIILSPLEIRAFQSDEGPVSSLLKNMVASRALLAWAAKSSNHARFEDARIIAADLLAEAREAITVAEQSNNSELAIDLRGCTRTLEKALARQS